ncbi:MAG: peptide deformylase [Bacteroidia bacterium]|nr:peptide deformylase [Bacteroidia bacterium]
MTGARDILKLGDPRLYQVCEDVAFEELEEVAGWVQILHDAMSDIRRQYGFGRGIAAPQLGIMKRLIYIDIDRPITMINPAIEHPSEAMFELWDDCMSFPNLLVKVKRHKSLTVRYIDEYWKEQSINAEDAFSELVQHEIDHLNGILCTMRAIDNKSFKYR